MNTDPSSVTFSLFAGPFRLSPYSGHPPLGFLGYCPRLSVDSFSWTFTYFHKTLFPLSLTLKKFCHRFLLSVMRSTVTPLPFCSFSPSPRFGLSLSSVFLDIDSFPGLYPFSLSLSVADFFSLLLVIIPPSSLGNPPRFLSLEIHLSISLLSALPPLFMMNVSFFHSGHSEIAPSFFLSVPLDCQVNGFHHPPDRSPFFFLNQRLGL